jgi:hypothetical protein
MMMMIMMMTIKANVIKEKHRYFKHELHLLIIDYLEVFDVVYRAKLWNILCKRGITHHLIAVIKNRHKDKINFTTNLGKVLTAEIDSGFRQARNMSPMLFIFNLTLL